MTPESVPNGYRPAPWVSVFSKRECQWLLERLDASNKSLRIANRALSASLDRLTGKQEEQ